MTLGSISGCASNKASAIACTSVHFILLPLKIIQH